jgi:hypothetical protein
LKNRLACRNCEGRAVPQLAPFQATAMVEAAPANGVSRPATLVRTCSGHSVRAGANVHVLGCLQGPAVLPGRLIAALEVPLNIVEHVPTGIFLGVEVHPRTGRIATSVRDHPGEFVERVVCDPDAGAWMVLMRDRRKTLPFRSRQRLLEVFPDPVEGVHLSRFGNGRRPAELLT